MYEDHPDLGDFSVKEIRYIRHFEIIECNNNYTPLNYLDSDGEMRHYSVSSRRVILDQYLKGNLILIDEKSDVELI